ncbi:MAG: DUF1929 domain-containing protein, partial [Actinomycetota bacterium]|nr:DUF1929 domain-containing protein [Actinomycetota bacterium]
RWEAGPLGYPLTDERPTPDGVGRYNHFERGSIYWTPATGAHEVHGAIRGLWEAELTADLGYPTSDEQWTPEGTMPPHRVRFSAFQHGSVYWVEHKGVFEVHAREPMTCDPARDGSWNRPWNSQVVGVHAALLHTNEVLFWSYEDPGHHTHAPQLYGAWSVLNLRDGSVRKGGGQAVQARNLFCAGQCLLGDGRVLIGGGERQVARNNHALTVYDPSTGWSSLSDLPKGRWYPTLCTLADGRAILLGGEDWPATAGPTPNDTYQLFDPALSTVGANVHFDAGFSEPGEDTYPFAYVLPRGRLLVHLGNRTRIVDSATLDFHAGVKLQTVRSVSRTYGNQGTSVLLPLRPHANPPYRAQVMVMGGAGAPSTIRTPATPDCEVLDVDASSLAWQPVAPMHEPRVMPDAVLLPDGTVFVTSGSRAGFADNGADPVYRPEFYDQTTDTWTQLCPMTVPRLYHSTATLLPDARVLVAGSDLEWNLPPFDVPQTDLEVYSPPYLFRGPRPQFLDEGVRPHLSASYGQDVAVFVSGPDVAEAVLVRCGSATHSFSSDQRLVEVTIIARAQVPRVVGPVTSAADLAVGMLRDSTRRLLPPSWQPARRWPPRSLPLPLPRRRSRAWPPAERAPRAASAQRLTLRLPTDGHIAPPGFYLLFVLSADRVPSNGRFVRLG